MMQKNYLPKSTKAKGISLWMAVLIVLTVVLLPSSASVSLAQGVHPSCLNDAGLAVTPKAGVGAWLFILNFNHAPNATNTLGCLVETTAVSPQVVKRTLVQCAIVNNVAGVQVGSGVSPFDGNYTVNCPGLSQGKQKLKNFMIWGHAAFANSSAHYPIVTHADVEFSADLDKFWHVNFSSRYGGSSFSSGHPTANLSGKIVEFTSEMNKLTGAHWLENVKLSPTPTLSGFDYHNDQPIIIGAAGSVWTLSEIIIDPPGGCCKGI